jgi:hypothetical protein
MFGQSYLWEVWHSDLTGSCIKTATHKLKAELSQPSRCCAILYVLVMTRSVIVHTGMTLCALVHAGRAGHNAVCCCTCWPWCCMLWYMLATVILYTLEHAGHDAVCALVNADSDDLHSCTCWPWYCAFFYVLATILYTLVFACHNTVYSCMCLPHYCILLYMLAMMLCAAVHTGHYTVHSCTC